MSEPFQEIVVADHEFKFEPYSMTGDNMNVLCRDGSLFDFEIEEPWAGDTETGFGHRCDISLPRDAAKALADWIYQRLQAAPAPR